MTPDSRGSSFFFPLPPFHVLSASPWLLFHLFAFAFPRPVSCFPLQTFPLYLAFIKHGAWQEIPIPLHNWSPHPQDHKPARWHAEAQSKELKRRRKKTAAALVFSTTFRISCYTRPVHFSTGPLFSSSPPLQTSTLHPSLRPPSLPPDHLFCLSSTSHFCRLTLTEKQMFPFGRNHSASSNIRLGQAAALYNEIVLLVICRLTHLIPQ